MRLPDWLKTRASLLLRLEQQADTIDLLHQRSKTLERERDEWQQRSNADRQRIARLAAQRDRQNQQLAELLIERDRALQALDRTGEERS